MQWLVLPLAGRLALDSGVLVSMLEMQVGKVWKPDSKLHWSILFVLVCEGGMAGRGME